MAGGISVYAGMKEYSDLNNIEYLELAKKYNLEYVFSSSHIAEANDCNATLKTIIDTTYNLGLKLILDVTKDALKNIPDDLINKVHTLRLDYGFTKEEIIALSNNDKFNISLNASTVSIEYLKELVIKGLDVTKTSLCYNFYPKKYTGHDIDFIFNRTKDLKALGFQISAFIPSFNQQRMPLYEKVPTVEEHRYQRLSQSINELIICGVDNIIFGDAYASTEEIINLSEHTKDYLLIEYTSSSNLELDNMYSVRKDNNSYIVRLNSRSVTLMTPYNTIERKKGAITIDNELFKRYQNEINICKKDLPCDERVNVVGIINETDFLLEHLHLTNKIKFKKIRKDIIC